MPKHISYRAFQQGELQKFGKLFVAPLLHNRPPKQSLEDFLAETFFHCDERLIVRCKAKRDFYLNGLLKITSVKKIVSRPRLIKKDAECYVRWDRTMPEKVDIETYLGQGGREYEFELTDLQFIAIKNHLHPMGSRGLDQFKKLCS